VEKLPWLDYTGQTTEELLACKSSYRIDSLLCAFEMGIQAKRRRITAEEKLVLAVMALDREVNNGGYSQFFANSSRKFAPIIVESLRRIDCLATTAITERAMAARRSATRDEILEACDQQFYKLNEIAPALFTFVEAHQDRIQLVKASLPPPPKLPELATAVKLFTYLEHVKYTLTPPRDLTLDEARHWAAKLSRELSIPATDDEREGAAVLYVFSYLLRGDDLAACEPLAKSAFELMREHTNHCVLHRKWVLKLIAASQRELADHWALAYLEFLKASDQSDVGTQNRIKFWADPLREHAAALPKSVQFFAANSPGAME
jgi:hypothetical protein